MKMSRTRNSVSTSEESWLSACHLRGVVKRLLGGDSWGAYFLLFFLPLIYIPNIFNPYEFPKFVFFVGGVFLLLLLNLRRLWSRPTTFKINTLTKLVLLYGLVVYLANLFGIDPKTSFLGSQFRHQGFITLLAGICLFLILRAERSERAESRSVVGYSSRQARTINYILLGAFSVCLVSVWQGIAFYLFKDPTIPTYQGRIVGTLGNPNSLAGYLVMVLPFVFVIRHLIPKIFLSSLIIIVIIFTDSRSAFLAVAIFFLAYGVRVMYKLKLWKKIIAILLVIAIASLLKGDLSVANQTPTVKERGCPESWPTVYPWKLISDIYNSKIFNVSREAPCDNRLLIWVVGLETLSKSPILGYGQENFEIAVPAGKMHSADNAHNIFLETAMSSGIIGLLIFLAVIILAFKRANFPIKMSLISFLVVASLNPLSIAQISLFWFFLGISDR